MKKNKILIFGGNGFIGSRLVSILKDYTVATFDIQKQFSDYDSKKAAKMFKYREGLLKGAKQYKGDVRDLAQVQKVIKAEKPNIIVCLSSIPLQTADKTEQLSTEVMGISNILRANEDLGARIVFMSSLFAIGYIDYAIPEKTALEPESNYGIGKATGEFLVKNLAKNYGIIRTTSVYGPGDVNNRISQIVLDKVLTGDKSSFWINKKSILDFIYIKDLAEGIKKVVLYNGNGIFHISQNKAVTILDFIKAVETCTGKKLNYEVRSFEDRIRRGSLANDKARLVLGWEPKFDLMSGIKDTISICKKEIKL